MYKYHGSSQLGSKRSGSNHPCLKKRSEELREGRGEQLVSKIRLEGGREWKRQPCPMRSADLTTHTIMAPLEQKKELGKAYAGAFFGIRVHHPWIAHWTSQQVYWQGEIHLQLLFNLHIRPPNQLSTLYELGPVHLFQIVSYFCISKESNSFHRLRGVGTVLSPLFPAYCATHFRAISVSFSFGHLPFLYTFPSV